MTKCYLFITFLIEDHANKFEKEISKDGWDIVPACWNPSGHKSLKERSPACVIMLKVTHAKIYNMDSVSKYMTDKITMLKLKVYSYFICEKFFEARVGSSNFELPKHSRKPNKVTGIIPDYLKVIK